MWVLEENWEKFCPLSFPKASVADESQQEEDVNYCSSEGEAKRSSSPSSSSSSSLNPIRCFSFCNLRASQIWVPNDASNGGGWGFWISVFDFTTREAKF
jgi:hypothetical protein